MAPTLVSLKTVLQRIPLSKTEIYRRIKAGTFPKQIHLGPSRIAFLESEVSDWIDAQRIVLAPSNGGQNGTAI